MSVRVWRRKILLKAKGLETGQGRRENFVPNPGFSLEVHTTVILRKSLKRPYSVSSLCEILLAAVDDLFHPDGPIGPQSVKCHCDHQKGPSMGTGVLPGIPVAGNSHWAFCIPALSWDCSDLSGELTEWIWVPVVQSVFVTG